jgi:hypothetical protein
MTSADKKKLFTHVRDNMDAAERNTMLLFLIGYMVDETTEPNNRFWRGVEKRIRKMEKMPKL